MWNVHRYVFFSFSHGSVVIKMGSGRRLDLASVALFLIIIEDLLLVLDTGLATCS